MSRFARLAVLVASLGGCSSTILLGHPNPDGGDFDAGPVPTVEVLPNPLDFGGISADGGSRQLTVRVLNVGSASAVVTFESAQPSPPFSTPDGVGVLPLGVGPPFLERTIGVTFAPTASSSTQGHLNYKVCAKGDGGGPCSPTQSITLHGNGF